MNLITNSTLPAAAAAQTPQNPAPAAAAAAAALSPALGMVPPPAPFAQWFADDAGVAREAAPADGADADPLAPAEGGAEGAEAADDAAVGRDDALLAALAMPLPVRMPAPAQDPAAASAPQPAEPSLSGTSPAAAVALTATPAPALSQVVALGAAPAQLRTQTAGARLQLAASGAAGLDARAPVHTAAPASRSANSAAPAFAPAPAPAAVPGEQSAAPSAAPSQAPSAAPSQASSAAPSQASSAAPSQAPSAAPAAAASGERKQNMAADTPAAPAAAGWNAPLQGGAPQRDAGTVALAGPPTAWRQSLQEALGDRMRYSVGNNLEQAVIRLDPPNLGRVEIAIRHSAGALEVSLTATHTEVVRQLHSVSENLRNDLAGRQYTEVAVTVAQAPRAPQQSGMSAFADGQGRQRQDGRPQDENGVGNGLAEAGNPSSTFSLNGRE